MPYKRRLVPRNLHFIVRNYQAL